MHKSLKFLTVFCATTFIGTLYADVVIPINQVAKNGIGQSLGTITIKDSTKGLVLIPNLHGLTPGQHGFHVHEFPSCDNQGEAAGSHYDPHRTDQHLGPYRNGHMGDLPVLIVDKNGKATQPLLAPNLKVSYLKGHALIIHAGGDNYSDKPQKLGGGGARIACGVIK